MDLGSRKHRDTRCQWVRRIRSRQPMVLGKPRLWTVGNLGSLFRGNAVWQLFGLYRSFRILWRWCQSYSDSILLDNRGWRTRWKSRLWHHWRVLQRDCQQDHGPTQTTCWKTPQDILETHQDLLQRWVELFDKRYQRDAESYFTNGDGSWVALKCILMASFFNLAATVLCVLKNKLSCNRVYWFKLFLKFVIHFQQLVRPRWLFLVQFWFRTSARLLLNILSGLRVRWLHWLK